MNDSLGIRDGWTKGTGDGRGRCEGEVEWKQINRKGGHGEEEGRIV